MRKVNKLLLILLGSFLLSSCNLASLLNDKLNFAAPANRCVLTFYDNEITNSSIVVDLGDSYTWDDGSVRIDLASLLEFKDFAAWYKGLDEKSDYSPVGLYNPISERAFIDVPFTAYKNEPLYVAWNSPMKKIRIYANNGYELMYPSAGPRYYDYYFDEPVPYDMDYGLSFSEAKLDEGFSFFLRDVGQYLYYKVRYNSDNYNYTDYHYGYHPVGFAKNGYVSTEYYYSTEYHYDYNQPIYKNITVNKWMNCLYLGWESGDPTFSTITIHSVIGDKKEDYVIDLGDEYSNYWLSWNTMLSLDSGFGDWYESLQYPGYKKTGVGSSPESSASWNPDYPDRHSYIYYSSQDLYVIWESQVKYVRVFSEKDSKESFVIELEDYVDEKPMTWDDFTGYAGFLNWYDSLSREGYVKRGITSTPEMTVTDCGPEGGCVYLYKSEEELHYAYLYVSWEKQFSSIQINANNGTDKIFTLELDEPVTRFDLTWNYLEEKGFSDWYESLTRSGYVKNGVGYSPDSYSCLAPGYYWVWPVTSNNEVLYVCWEKAQRISEANSRFNLETYFGLETGTYQYYSYDLRNSNGDSLGFAQAKEFKVTSADDSIAEVQEGGSVLGVSPGSTYITMSVTDYLGYHFEKTVNVEVKDYVEFKMWTYYYEQMTDFDCTDDGSYFTSYNDSELIHDAFLIRVENGIQCLDESNNGEFIVYADKKGNVYMNTHSRIFYNEPFVLVYPVNSDYGIPKQIAVNENGDKVVFISEDSTGESHVVVLTNEGYSIMDGTVGETSTWINGQSMNTVDISYNGQVIAIGTSLGLFYSDDGGVSYKSYGAGSGSVDCVRACANSILFSVPDGNNYALKTLDLMNYSVTVLSLASDPLFTPVFWASRDCNQILYNSRSGIDYFYSYYGNSWNAIHTNLYSTSKIKILNEHGRVLCLVNDGDHSTIYQANLNY